MLTVTSEISTEKIEELYEKLSSQKGKDYVDLAIPIKPNFVGFGALSSFLQFIMTWRRLDNCGKLIIKSKQLIDISDDDIQYIIKQYYGFVASVLAWDKGIINGNGQSIKIKFKKPNSEFSNLLLKRKFEESARGDSILFPFFDHLEVGKGLLPIVYRNGILQDEKEFESLIESLIEITTKNNSVLRKNYKSLQKALTGIVYELFDNTNKWAKHSYSGKILNPNVRGIFGKFYKLDLYGPISYANSFGLKRYFRKIRERGSTKGEFYKYITFLEVSVFDSGPGLAQRYARKDLTEMTLDQEYATLLQCLRKHITSHSRSDEYESRGLGLHRIMELLASKGGFLKVRSGRLLLYRDFYTHPFINPNRGDHDYSLLDWDNNGTRPMARSRCEGTLITIILPFALLETVNTNLTV